MQEVITRGTASSARSLGFKLPAAGKTGTTNDFKDAWFIGFTSSMTCGVWVGFDQPTTIIPRGYGSALALPIWTQVMMKAADRYPAEQCTPPVASSKRPFVRSPMRSRRAVASPPARPTRLIFRSTESLAESAKCMVAARRCSGGRWNKFQPKVKEVPRSIIQSFKRFFGGGN